MGQKVYQMLDSIPYIIINLLAWGLWEVKIVLASHYAAVLPTKYVKMGSKSKNGPKIIESCQYERSGGWLISQFWFNNLFWGFGAYECVSKFSKLLLNQKMAKNKAYVGLKNIKNHQVLGRTWQCYLACEKGAEMFYMCSTT